MAATSIELLELSTMEGQSTTPRCQDISDSIDTSRHESAVATMRVIEATLCVLHLEGSDDGQSFVSIKSMSAADNQPVYLSKTQQPGETTRLYRVLRWRVVPTDAGWVCCGRISVVLK